METNLKIGNINSSDYGVYLINSEVYMASEFDFNTYEIPGRNGDLHISNGRRKNKTIPFEFMVKEEYINRMDEFISKIGTLQGYQRLECDHYPERYRMGYIDSIDYGTNGYTSGTFTINYSCRPEKYLESGDVQQSFVTNGTITNPTPCEAKPLIRVYGKGTITVGDTVIKVNTLGDEYIDIDIDSMQAYEGDLNRNSYITVTKWGGLNEGENTLTMTSGISEIIVTPRWCYL